MDLQNNQGTNFDEQNQKVFEAAQMCKQRNQIVSQLNLYQFLKNQDEEALSRKWRAVDLKSTKLDNFLVFLLIASIVLSFPAAIFLLICLSGFCLLGFSDFPSLKQFIDIFYFFVPPIFLIVAIILRKKRKIEKINNIKQEARTKLPEHTEKVNFYASQLQALESKMETECIITSEFWQYGEIVADLIRCHRADNLKEALNLLVSDMQHYEMMQQQRIQSEQQEIIKNQLDATNRQIRSLNTSVLLSNWLR